MGSVVRRAIGRRWRAFVAIAAMVVLTSGCATTTTPSVAVVASVAPSSSMVASAAPTPSAISSPTPVTTPALTPAAPAPTPAAATPAASGATFHACSPAPKTATCLLKPDSYTTASHDSFRFSIAEDGWQEERTVAGEFETRVLISRVKDPRQRLSFLSGPTGLTAPVAIDPTHFNIPGFKAGQPTDITISGTAAQYIDLEPAGAKAASSVSIEGQTITVEPDRRYRFTVAKIPMDQEAATVIMVTEAPADTFATFVTMADKVLQTVKFPATFN